MAKIDVIEYKSWMEFKSSIIPELYEDQFFLKDLHLFRGQASADWELEPSFDRYFRTIDKKERQGTYRELLALFKKECERMDVPADVLDDNSRLTALGQHYGLPTRLLDWTDSPYVASFFAFNDAVSLASKKSSNVAVWALDTRLKSIWSPESGVEILEVPSISNVRLRNQFGKFTISKTPFNCLEDYVNFCSEKEVALRKFLIPAQDCEMALADLDAMGINHSRIYPELVGCALAAKTRIFLEKNLF